MGRVLDVDYARQRKATPKVGQSQTSSYVASMWLCGVCGGGSQTRLDGSKIRSHKATSTWAEFPARRIGKDFFFCPRQRDLRSHALEHASRHQHERHFVVGARGRIKLLER